MNSAVRVVEAEIDVQKINIITERGVGSGWSPPHPISQAFGVLKENYLRVISGKFL